MDRIIQEPPVQLLPARGKTFRIQGKSTEKKARKLRDISVLLRPSSLLAVSKSMMLSDPKHPSSFGMRYAKMHAEFPAFSEQNKNRNFSDLNFVLKYPSVPKIDCLIINGFRVTMDIYNLDVEVSLFALLNVRHRSSAHSSFKKQNF